MIEPPQTSFDRLSSLQAKGGDSSVDSDWSDAALVRSYENTLLTAVTVLVSFV